MVLGVVIIVGRRATSLIPPQSYRQKLLDGLVASLALTPIPAKKLLNSLKPLVSKPPASSPGQSQPRLQPRLRPHSPSLQPQPHSPSPTASRPLLEVTCDARAGHVACPSRVANLLSQVAALPEHLRLG
eukprot:scaffold102134_cov51-Phaeocystis_antarctica.AAC.2